MKKKMVENWRYTLDGIATGTALVSKLKLNEETNYAKAITN